MSSPRTVLHRYAKAERMVKLLGGEFGGFKLVVVKPHFIYGKVGGGMSVSKTVVLTDFFNARRVKLVDDYKGKDFRELRIAIEELGNRFSSIDIHESSGINSFYEEKTKTIYLFDV